MDTKKIIQSQFQASLQMLEQVVVKCPEPLWNALDDQNKTWHVVYHALFYTHLYLQASEKDFQAWEKHHPDYESLGRLPWPPHDLPKIGEPYSREDLLAYLEIVRGQVRQCIPSLDLEGPSGFSWQPFSKLELQMYNLRHLQHHTAELYERLGSRAGIDLDWICNAN